MKGNRSYRIWMAILLAMLVGLIPLRMALMRWLPHETPADKRVWLLWMGALLMVAIAFLIALIWLVLKDFQQIAEQYRKAHREAFEEMTEQIRADYRRKQQERTSRNGTQRS